MLPETRHYFYLMSKASRPGQTVLPGCPFFGVSSTQTHPQFPALNTQRHACHLPVVPALGRLRQASAQFEIRLGNRFQINKKG